MRHEQQPFEDDEFSRGILEGIEDGEVNIDSAERLIIKLEELPVDELSQYVEEIREMLLVLREEQANGIDTPEIRKAIANLTRLGEKARK